MDRISQLPETITHHILSLLDSWDWSVGAKDRVSHLVRMSVLSKTWLNLTASFPVLFFCIHDFESRESFFKYVDYTTSRFCRQIVAADTLKLSTTTLREPAELDVVNRCLELVLKNGVRELVINIVDDPSASLNDMPKYRLSNTLLSVSELESLKIVGCELPSSLMIDVVKFKSLIQLKLENVHINDEAIKYLTTSCPLLQKLSIIKCHGFNAFCVYGHQNLQEVGFHYTTHVERIDIEAPNLSLLMVVDWHQRGAPPMSLASCEKLKTVVYFGHPLPNSDGFSGFLSNFPFIENLCLVTKFKWKNLKLSSHSLKTLLLHSTCNLEDIEFGTPNLDLFIYSCNNRLLGPLIDKSWPLVRDSIHLKACMQCYTSNYIDSIWFGKLRLYLDKNNGFKVLNLYIHAPYSKNMIELEKLKAMELPPFELEHVVLQLGTNGDSTDHITFLEAVLWCCRPRSLTIRSPIPFSDFEKQGDVVKFTYEKLLEQEDQDHTNIQIVLPSSSEAQKHFMDLKSLLLAFPREGKTISFVKEEAHDMHVFTYNKVCI